MQSGDRVYQFLQSPAHVDTLMGTKVLDGEIEPSCSSSSSPNLAALWDLRLHYM